MRMVVTAFALVLLVLGASSLVAPGVASAQYRQFTGRIDKINEKQVIVDNRKGDKVKFAKNDGTVVEGEGKKVWKDLKKGDWVSVDWKFIDKPRKAYKVQVLPPREDD
jgi:hypothetical protein